MFRKGKKGNQSDYNYFVKRNSDLLPYLTKQQNAEGVHCIMPGQFSEGTLGRSELVISLQKASSSEVSHYQVRDALHSGKAAVSWTGKMSAVKTMLKSYYPSASKVTFLFSFAPRIVEASEELEFVSQSISHTAVTIELYKESAPGEDEMTAVAYFTPYFAGSPLSELIAKQSESFGGIQNVIALHGATADDYDLFDNLAVLVFATDDNASDCYSTIVPSDGVPPTKTAWSLYSTFRTRDALRAACDSYGYQSGVMRDDIAKVGNDLQALQMAYNARLRSLGLDIESAEE